MRKLLLPFVLVVLLTQSLAARAQGIAPPTDKSAANYKRIEAFVKVWGFLKYHHPAVATGKIHWDSVFVNNLPLIRNAGSDTAFNNRLTAIIDNLGPVEEKEIGIPADIMYTDNHDISWIGKDVLLSAALKKKLNDVYRWRNQGDNHFIKMDGDRPDYSGERKYTTMVFPDQNYRLLFLSRFWNAINYFAPYKYEIGEDWNLVLRRFIPKMVLANDSVTYYKTLLHLAVSLNDGHAQLWYGNENSPPNDAAFGKYTAPLYVDIVNDTVVVRKSANDTLTGKANIQRGDIVLSIDNEPALTRLGRPAYISGSNNVGRQYEFSKVLFSTRDTIQTLQIKRGNQVINTKVKTILASTRSYGDLSNYTVNETGYKSVGKSIAYIYAMQIWRGNMDSIKALIGRKKAVIIDCRNHPNNGDVLYTVFDSLLTEPKVINSSLNLDINHPGFFHWKNSGAIGRVNKKPYTGNVIILADERSQSQGEYTVMAFQTIPGSVTIGSQTAGLDGVQTFIPMGGKLSLSYSGYGVFYPDKTPTQRRGVRIDIQAIKTVESAAAGRDVAVEAALTYLKGKGID